MKNKSRKVEKKFITELTDEEAERLTIKPHPTKGIRLFHKWRFRLFLLLWHGMFIGYGILFGYLLGVMS